MRRGNVSSRVCVLRVSCSGFLDLETSFWYADLYVFTILCRNRVSR